MNTYKVYCVGGVNFTVNADSFGTTRYLGDTSLKGTEQIVWIAFHVEETVVRYVYGPNVISIEIVPPKSAEKSTKLKQAERVTTSMRRGNKSITEGFG